MTKWIDVSVPIKNGLAHWPGDAPFKFNWIKRISRVSTDNLSRLSLGTHTGTHMDSPFHFLKNGRNMDSLPFEAVIGPVRVLELKNRTAATVAELEKYRVKKGERILLKTQNSRSGWPLRPFIKNFVYIPGPTAAYLAKKKIMTLGVDYLSVGGYKKDGCLTHRTLLKAGIWIIEGLDLSQVKPGRYELVCLPLRVWHSEGAPCRALLRPLGL